MSRYYDPEIGQFISMDTPDYLAPDTIGGVDLYAYCSHNPVMKSDPTGHFPKWLKNIVKGSATIIMNGVKAVQNVLKQIDITSTTGLSFNLSIGYIAVTGQIGISTDPEGNIETQGTVASGLTTSMDFGMSLGIYQTFSNAPDVNGLERWGTQKGGNIGLPLIGPLALSAGLDGNTFIDEENNTEYQGFSCNAALGFGTADPELHHTKGYTSQIGENFNIFSEIEKIYSIIMGW